MTDIIIMSKKDLDRMAVIRDLVNKRIKGREAAKLLKLSARQIRRLKNKFKKFGAKGLVHRNRGQRGHNHLPDKLLSKIRGGS